MTMISEIRNPERVYQPSVAITSSGSDQDARINAFMDKYGIDAQYESAIRNLADYEIVVIADDSGSMLGRMGTQSHTKWVELKRLLITVAKIATIFDSNGFDLVFLNRASQKSVQNSDLIDTYFRDEPDGGTPLLRRLDEVMSSYRRKLEERKLLVFVATDGEPSDGNMVNWFETKFTSDPLLRERVAVSFVMCTEEERVLKVYNETIDEIKGKGSNQDLNIDVSDAYPIQRARVLSNNPSINYSEGTHLAKVLTGSFTRSFDLLDQKRVAAKNGVVIVDQVPKACCTVS